MPQTVDNDQLNQTAEAVQRIAQRGQTPIVTLNPANPPTVQIPHLEFPRVVYQHPVKPFRKVEHRNAMREIVQVEMVANEHLTRVVADQADLDQALAAGWKKEPYIPEPAPDPMAGIYAKGKSA
jgi:hypothetical protein